MRLEAAQFFQPVASPTTSKDKRSPLITSVRADAYDLVLDGNYIRVSLKGEKCRPTYVTVYNTCWFIPLEEQHESSTDPGPPAGESKAKIKRRAVAVDQLPRANSVHPGSGAP